METIVTTFNFGNSVVSVWPKSLGLSAGIKVNIKKGKSAIVATIGTRTESETQKNIAIIKKLAGSMKYSSHMTPEEMNRSYDKEVYE